MVVEPGEGFVERRGGVAERYGRPGVFRCGPAAGLQAQSLGHGELLEVLGDLLEREQRIAPGVGDERRGATGIGLSDVGGRSTLHRPRGDIVGVLSGLEVREDLLRVLIELVLHRSAGEVGQVGDRGEVPAVVLVAGDQVLPRAQRDDGVHTGARIVRRDEPADEPAVGPAEERDTPRAEVLLSVVAHGRAVGPVQGAGHVDRLGFSPRREDQLQGSPVTVYALDRPAGLHSR